MAITVESTSWEAFRTAYQRSSERFVRGDATAVLALYADTDPMHICGAFGGYEHGADVVRQRVAWAGAQFSEGTFHEELIEEWVGADSAVTLAVETIEAKVADGDRSVRQVLRVTQVYRREGADWRIAHRHADFLRPTSTDVPTDVPAREPGEPGEPGGRA